MVNKLGVFCVAACLPVSLLADFSYQTSTKMTGGAMMGMMKVAGVFSKQAGEPIQSTVSVKGNKMVHATKERLDVIDLDSETITNIDLQKKTYSVMTFAEMAQAMENAVKQMNEKKTAKNEKGESTDVTTDFKVSVKSTGASKQ